MSRSKLLLVSAILSGLYFLFLAFQLLGSIVSSKPAEAIGGGLVSVFMAPHLILVLLALIFNVLGYYLNVRWGALTAGILYIVSILFLFWNILFLIIQAVLCFVAFAKMPNNQNISA